MPPFLDWIHNPVGVRVAGSTHRHDRDLPALPLRQTCSEPRPSSQSMHFYLNQAPWSDQSQAVTEVA